jgi:TPR repeat protein
VAATQATAQDFAKGYAAYQAGDYQTAFKEWAPLAEQRETYSQYNLGLFYNNGEGVPQDNVEAVKMVPLG